jgi:flagellar assembly protein FliH
MPARSTSEAPVAEKNSSNKVISDQQGKKVKQWTPPEMTPTSGPGLGSQGHRSLLTAEQLEHIQQQAYNEGFELGKKEGFAFGHKEVLATGRQELLTRVEQMEDIISTLETPLKKLDDQIEREVVELIIATVRQLVRREVKTDPEQIIGVVREALSILPVTARNIRLVLHPEDAELVREIYDVNEKEVGWTIVEDPVLERGGCKVLTDISQVDATLESRLTTLVTQLLGGERTRDISQEETDE